MSSPKAYAAFLLSDYTDVRNVWTTQVGVKENTKGVLLFLFRGVTLFRSSTFEHYPFVGSDSDAFARKVARVLRTETQLVFVCLSICTILHDLYGNTRVQASHVIRRLHRFDVSVLIQSTLKFDLKCRTVHCAVFG